MLQTLRPLRKLSPLNRLPVQISRGLAGKTEDDAPYTRFPEDPKYGEVPKVFPFKNPNVTHQYLKTYVMYMQLRKRKTMYFTAFKHDKNARRIPRKVFYALFYPHIPHKGLKWPLFATSQEPSGPWAFVKKGNNFFREKKTMESYKTDPVDLFQAAVRLTSPHVQFMVMLKTHLKLKEAKDKPAEGAAAPPAAASAAEAK